ncbi:hypothetical protein [Telluribacter sp.]|jgi:hypothetical protein|uniref:hypothetical protein n=1 Tax=Telluribacter sp. TaxID=1978767 RepID=UPI002E104D68|nr:hypothetical protein [Telluribacter sp.]
MFYRLRLIKYQVPMKIGDKLLKILEKTYAPSSSISRKFERYDITIVTDEEGNPHLLYIGNRSENGLIKGNRFTRTLLKDKEGKVIKDHWDNLGKI